MARTNDLVTGSKKISNSSHTILCLLFSGLIVATLYLRGNSSIRLVEDHSMLKNSLKQCDLFFGKWVFDNKSYPLYKEQKCTFMKDDFACQKYGRKDSNYMHWRWKPHNCDLPRSICTSL